MTDIPLPAPGSPDWFDWGAEQEELSDAAREIISGRLTAAALRATFVAIVTGLATGTGAGTATANAAVLQAAIDAAASADGGTLIIPIGTWTTAPLKMKTRVRLVGMGWGSRLRLVNGGNDHLVGIADANQVQTEIRDIWLDGNAANQSAGNWDVVNLDNTGYTASGGIFDIGDPNHMMSRVVVFGGKRDGVRVQGSFSQSQFDKVLVTDCDNNSFGIWAPDCHFINCVSRRSGLDGFGIRGNSERLLNCKAFLSGRINSSQGSGFYIQGVNEADLTHCEAQDNRQHGFSLNTTTTTSLVACRADRNGLGPEPVTSGGLGDGIFLFNVTQSRIDVVSTDRNADGLKQRWAYNCSTGNSGNIVTITAGATATGAVGVGSFGLGSAVTITYAGAIIRTVNTQTAAYTLTSDDAEAEVSMNSASAVNLTVPPNSSVAYPVGTRIELSQVGAGQVTVVPGTGVTVNSRGSALKLAGQQAQAELRKTATNTWRLYGDITT